MQFGYLVLASLGALAAVPCESLSQLKLACTTITAAAALPSYCRVQATLRPTSDSEIKIEVWMPETAQWNGKFMGVGNGGWAAVRRGYAAASTDTGMK